MTNRAVAYARFSSDLQCPASIEDQLRECRRLAERHGWVIVAECVDPALSGTLRNRPGLDRLLALLADGQVDYVIADTFDRFHRDEEHSAGLRKRVNFRGARIATVEEGGVVNPMSASLRGMMGAMYLEDLARRTHRGMTGVVLSGRAAGPIAYGYRAIHRVGANGELIRGLREIDEAEAVVVRRIFTSYTANMSPLAIAQQLNAAAIPGPGGSPWREDTIRGRASRAEGILRNPLYDGRYIWNRQQNLRDPDTGGRVRRTRDATEHVGTPMEELRIVPHDLWLAVQARLAANAAPMPRIKGSGHSGCVDKRRPRHLLTKKAFCGVCGGSFASIGKDYLGCRDGHNGACANRFTIRRAALTSRVVAALRTQLMPPTLVTAFVEAHQTAWRDLTREATLTARAAPTAIAAIDRKIANLVDAIADGTPSAPLRTRIATLQAERATLQRTTKTTPHAIPDLPDNLAARYRDEINHLIAALEDRTNLEVLDLTRRLIDRVIVTPPETDDDPPKIELIGDLGALLKAAIKPNPTQAADTTTAILLNSFASSVKQAPGAQPPAGPGQSPGLALFPPPRQRRLT